MATNMTVTVSTNNDPWANTASDDSRPIVRDHRTGAQTSDAAADIGKMTLGLLSPALNFVSSFFGGSAPRLEKADAFSNSNLSFEDMVFQFMMDIVKSFHDQIRAKGKELKAAQDKAKNDPDDTAKRDSVDELTKDFSQIFEKLKSLEETLWKAHEKLNEPINETARSIGGQ